MRLFKLSPSDFGFLYHECAKCYYDKYALGFARPRTGVPRIFNVIDELITKRFDNAPAQDLCPDIPPGIITLGGLQVKSVPLRNDRLGCEIVISGRIDSAIQFDDGSFGIIDFKTTEPSDRSKEMYSHQLMSYKVAMEHNDPTVTKKCTISRMGLACFTPKAFDHARTDADWLSMSGPLKWVEIPIDMPMFKRQLSDIAELLTGDRPEPSASCQFCSYVTSSLSPR